MVWLEEPLRYASDTRVRIHRSRGGSAANVAAMAAPSVRTVFIGRVGADAVGDALTGRLAAAGVEVRVQREGVTGTIVVLVDADGERTMLPDRGAALDLADVDPAWAADLTHVHLPAYSLVEGPLRDSATAVATAARARGATISVDASSTGVIQALGADWLLRTVDDLGATYLFANGDEALMLGLFGPGRAVVPRTTIIAKDGPRPTTVLLPGGESLMVPVPRVDGVRDLTGAGDAFAAGFLAAACTGSSTLAAVEAGHRSAAGVLTSPGSGTPAV